MNEILQEAIPLIGTVLGTALATFAVQIARRIAQKHGIQLQAAQEAQLEMAVRRGVSYAEERARQAIKSTRMSSEDKLSAAVEHAQTILPKADASTIARVAQSVLPEMRQSGELAGAKLPSEPPGKA